jgi:hypothetical protein
MVMKLVMRLALATGPIRTKRLQASAMSNVPGFDIDVDFKLLPTCVIEHNK